MSSSKLDPEALALRGRIGGLTVQARHGERIAANARKGFLAKFLAEVDRDNPGLPEAERQRHADLLLRAHMTRLTLKSKEARARRNKLDSEIEAAEAELAAMEADDVA